LSVNNAVTAVQWYDGATPVPGATGFNYQPLVTGNYWAQVQQFGCTDSTATLTFNIHAMPWLHLQQAAIQAVSPVILLFLRMDPVSAMDQH
jgi:hypothetical protein